MGSTAAIRTIDARLIDDLFGMNSGYVLDFSDRTFSAFFAEELGINIDESRYSAEGTSKAKRLRYFLKISTPDLRARTLTALWEYREAGRRRSRSEETVPDAAKEFAALVERVGGRKPKPVVQPASTVTAPSCAINAALAAQLKVKLLAVSNLAPQPRGYAYESFLKDVFDANGLGGRAAFRLVGEQIDGSFELQRDLPARSEVDRTADRRGRPPRVQRQGRGQGVLVPRTVREPQRFYRRGFGRVRWRKTRHLHGRSRHLRHARPRAVVLRCDVEEGSRSRGNGQSV
jgi:hypothetical protein